MFVTRYLECFQSEKLIRNPRPRVLFPWVGSLHLASIKILDSEKVSKHSVDLEKSVVRVRQNNLVVSHSYQLMTGNQNFQMSHKGQSCKQD